MKIYTKTGDDGTTSLFGGRRLLKDDLRIEGYGTIDELNSYIGIVRDSVASEDVRARLKEIQDRLFTIGSNLASDGTRNDVPDLHDSDVELLESEIDVMDAVLPALRNFILPGGHLAVSFCHVARCVCRRAERLTVALHSEEPVDPILLRYLNRLSDYLFTLSRKIAQDVRAEEITWSARG